MTRQITLLQINDTHGYLEPHPELFWEGGRELYRTAGGFARIAALFERVRRERPGTVIALDNGDTFHGTYPVVASRGEALVPLLNALRLDGMTAHWDFAYGPEQLRRLSEQLTYPMLAINCFDQETGGLAFRPSTLVERGGVRVGIIGIVATIVDKTMPEHFSTGLRFTLGRDELPGHVRRLREEGAELIVVLSHLGFPQDVRLASEVSGVDVLLSGHTHNRIEEPVQVGDTWIIQSGCPGSFVGRLDLELPPALHSEGERVRIRRVTHTLLRVDDTLTPDPAMEALVDAAVSPHRGFLESVVGETETPLSRHLVFESTMDRLLLAAVAEAGEARIAFSNGWRYGAPIPPGPITEGDLWNMVPSNPPVSLVEMTGAEMRSMMEENLERTFSCDPYAQMGGYVKRCYGVTLHVKLENSEGFRIQDFYVGDENLDPHATYKVAFITSQGVPARYGRNRRDLTVRAVDALRNYLSRHSPFKIESLRTVVAV